MLSGLIPLLILLATPHVYAESDSKRAHDGYNDGSNAASQDTNFNPACDPTGAHTSHGQHTSIHCNSWSDGYITTWNRIHPNQVSQSQNQEQEQNQRQNQAVHTCIALKCEIIQGGVAVIVMALIGNFIIHKFSSNNKFCS